MADKLMTADDLAEVKGTTGLNIRRAARKFRGTPHAFGQYLSGKGKRGRWIFTGEDVARYDNLPEEKRQRGGSNLKKVQVVISEEQLSRVDALTKNRSVAVREGLDLWLKRQERREKASKS